MIRSNGFLKNPGQQSSRSHENARRKQGTDKKSNKNCSIDNSGYGAGNAVPDLGGQNTSLSLLQSIVKPSTDYSVNLASGKARFSGRGHDGYINLSDMHAAMQPKKQPSNRPSSKESVKLPSLPARPALASLESTQSKLEEDLHRHAKNLLALTNGFNRARLVKKFAKRLTKSIHKNDECDDEIIDVGKRDGNDDEIIDVVSGENTGGVAMAEAEPGAKHGVESGKQEMNKWIKKMSPLWAFLALRQKHKVWNKQDNADASSDTMSDSLTQVAASDLSAQAAADTITTGATPISGRSSTSMQVPQFSASSSMHESRVGARGLEWSSKAEDTNGQANEANVNSLQNGDVRQASATDAEDIIRGLREQMTEERQNLPVEERKTLHKKRCGEWQPDGVSDALNKCVLMFLLGAERWYLSDPEKVDKNGRDGDRKKNPDQHSDKELSHDQAKNGKSNRNKSQKQQSDNYRMNETPIGNKRGSRRTERKLGERGAHDFAEEDEGGRDKKNQGGFDDENPFDGGFDQDDDASLLQIFKFFAHHKDYQGRDLMAISEWHKFFETFDEEFPDVAPNLKKLNNIFNTNLQLQIEMNFLHDMTKGGASRGLNFASFKAALHQAVGGYHFTKQDKDKEWEDVMEYQGRGKA
eukprot:gnl/MRDRNA2_/MRDRNA2_103651_c0_seq1.p1 gnl/MRDRNA2_/MRDRNA2_103651_c0~~gnl/MRDRNA2_/MRDRNA2_103651_c0_seq1.p1  ORF type:complete len:640 (-),score=134.20 gnl/MRDRNA2_/MRDRNA2_103651_c0_seq1:95-2014(-)